MRSKKAKTTRRTTPRVARITLLLFLAGAAAAGLGARNALPGILLVSLDTLRADAAREMPFLRGLASEGVAFPRVYSASNWTLPAHASLFLSQPYSEHRLPAPGSVAPFAGQTLDPAATTLPEALRRAGFHTFGSTEGGWTDQSFGFARGFSEFQQVPALSHAAGADLDRHLEGLVRSLERAAGRPFFAFVHTYRIHDYFLNDDRFHGALFASDDELAASGSLLDRMQREAGDVPPADFLERLYRGATLDADRFLQRLVEAAQRVAPDRSWYVIVTSDHGEDFRGAPRRRFHGTSLVEAQLRIPWVAWASDGSLARLEPAPIAGTIDLAPSLLHRFDVPVPASFRGRRELLIVDPVHSPLPGVALESAFYTANAEGRSRFQLALLEPDRALIWSGRSKESPQLVCLAARTSAADDAVWQGGAAGSCDDLAVAARENLDRWQIGTDPERRAGGVAADSALADELRSLGYLGH